MPGRWKSPLSAPFNVGTMLLLTDGSVLAQNSGTRFWWRLRPDRMGGYDQGEWTPTGSSASAPLYFASAVMADGAVLVAGGEYDNNASQASDLRTVERYDPTTETWESLPAPSGWTMIGDAPCCVLPNGRLLMGSIADGACALWDPAARAWSPAGAKRNGTSSEETWTLLPDGSVLTVDCVGAPASERFVNGAWIANGETPVELVEQGSLEIGPAVLLPDGTVIALGATGHAARFTPDEDINKPGVWMAAPDIPSDRGGRPLGAKDAPACLLPNGRVLCAVGPVDRGAAEYDGPTTFLEFDPADADAWRPLAPPPGGGGAKPYMFRFLLTPTGEVLVSDGTGQVQVFEPDGAPKPEWAPKILDCPTAAEAGSTHRLDGAQLNGLSQACAYGDDAAMATNYPLVRLRGPYPSPRVTYCRTFNHSTMAVATGRSAQHTWFEIPATVAPGAYTLSVVANGVGSAERPLSVTVARAAPDAPKAERRPFAEAELFLRDLSEVHLLIDFISGRTDKSLSGLKDAVGYGEAGKASEPLTEQEIIEEICRISYPPQGGLEANAEEAAYMLVVKDRLNYLATPARGLTIAFTSMCAGVAVDLQSRPVGWWSCLKAWLKSKLPSKFCQALEAKRKAEAGLYPESSRYFSARLAFPNLEHQARRFRKFYDRLPRLALLLVLVIGWMNWNTGVVGAVLDEASSAEKAYTDLFDVKQAFIPTVAACNPAPADAQGAAPPAPPPPSGTEPRTAANRVICAQAEAEMMRLRASRANLEKVAGPGTLLSPVGMAVQLMDCPYPGRLAPLCPRAQAAGPAVVTGPTGPAAPTATLAPSIADRPAPEAAPIALEYLSRDVITGINIVILPSLFGLLGTIVGLMRTITTKVRENLLAPRDEIVAKIGVGLGMSAGLAVGLFLNGLKGPSATITLTAAGLSFLAGFAAEAFFTFLDGFVGRVFTAGSASANSAALATGAAPLIRPATSPKAGLPAKAPAT